MKKLVAIVAIMIVICLSIVGCTNSPAYSAIAITSTATCGKEAVEYRTDDYHPNDYFVCVLYKTDGMEYLPLIDEETGTFNYMLVMYSGDTILEWIKPIEELTEIKQNGDVIRYGLTFHTNYTLSQMEYMLTINLGNEEYINIKLEEAAK